jgi:hypothetical protein
MSLEENDQISPFSYFKVIKAEFYIHLKENYFYLEQLDYKWKQLDCPCLRSHKNTEGM